MSRFKPGDLVEIVVPLEAGDNIKGIVISENIVEKDLLSTIKILTSTGIVPVHPSSVRKIDEPG